MLFVLLMSAILSSFCREAHPFYFSKTTIVYSEKDHGYQISLSLFADDLEKAMAIQGKPALKLHTDKEHPDAEKMLADYIRQHLLIELDGKKMELKWVGKEKGEEPQVLWCYLEIPAPAHFKKGSISNDLLLEVTDAQKNLVTFIPVGNESQHLLFMKDNTIKTITP